MDENEQKEKSDYENKESQAAIQDESAKLDKPESRRDDSDTGLDDNRHTGDEIIKPKRAEYLRRKRRQGKELSERERNQLDLYDQSKKGEVVAEHKPVQEYRKATDKAPEYKKAESSLARDAAVETVAQLLLRPVKMMNDEITRMGGTNIIDKMIPEESLLECYRDMAEAMLPAGASVKPRYIAATHATVTATQFGIMRIRERRREAAEKRKEENASVS